MSRPSNCPFCEAATEYTSDLHTSYTCWTVIHGHQNDPRSNQSRPCVLAERDQLLERNRELEDALEVLVCACDDVQSKGYAFAQLDRGVVMARAAIAKHKETKP